MWITTPINNLFNNLSFRLHVWRDQKSRNLNWLWNCCCFSLLFTESSSLLRAKSLLLWSRLFVCALDSTSTTTWVSLRLCFFFGFLETTFFSFSWNFLLSSLEFLLRESIKTHHPLVLTAVFKSSTIIGLSSETLDKMSWEIEPIIMKFFGSVLKSVVVCILGMSAITTPRIYGTW